MMYCNFFYISAVLAVAFICCQQVNCSSILYRLPLPVIVDKQLRNTDFGSQNLNESHRTEKSESKSLSAQHKTEIFTDESEDASVFLKEKNISGRVKRSICNSIEFNHKIFEIIKILYIQNYRDLDTKLHHFNNRNDCFKIFVETPEGYRSIEKLRVEKAMPAYAHFRENEITVSCDGLGIYATTERIHQLVIITSNIPGYNGTHIGCVLEMNKKEIIHTPDDKQHITTN